MTSAYDKYEKRVRARAHEIWLQEGKPEGRAEAHWALAREEISTEENIEETLKPNPMNEAPIDGEPLLAVEGMADLPGRLSDQGDRQDYPHPAHGEGFTRKSETKKPAPKKKPEPKEAAKPAAAKPKATAAKKK
jgi:hypothetical protein